MFDVKRRAADRLDVTVSGKIDAVAAAEMVGALFRESVGIENGRMLVDIEHFDLPTFGAFRFELSQLPELFRFSRQFAFAAVLADEAWVRAMSAIESKVIPGLVIKPFRKDQRYHAETWLANVKRDANGA